MQVGLVFNQNPRILYYTTDQDFEIGTSLVVNTARGLELGVVKKCKQGEAPEPLDLVRIATEKDISLAAENIKDASGLVSVVKNEIKVGDNVKIKGKAKTYDGKTLLSFCYGRTYKVKSITGDKVVITFAGIIVAGMKKSDLEKC